ncbi:ABC transporter permease [Fontisphaera persica]|jgi:ABC-2 type transport system permease protein|uniref:ABC transporter permease n=1 Tax=Fontisphaera persica TaxID=2974023 RepID=UPI0024BFF2C0|nr:ABC transporter permease [Fontisphaera persica]WCJ60792.1 ABC transporter permease [Fontisphaera persica]
MRAYLLLVRREMGTFFVSWTGYMVIAAVLFIMGLSFAGILQALNTEPLTLTLNELFYESVAFWLVLLVATPVITMRLFAQEKQTGTFETLMTTPVSDLQVVLAKFTAALLFYACMWLPLIVITLALRHYTRQPAAVDLGALSGAMGGVFLIGMLYVAIGCLASALTRSQVIAAMLSFVAGLAIFLAGYLAYAVPPQLGWPHAVLNQMNLYQHLQDFSRGVVDTRAVVFCLSTTFLFLFLTLRAVESRRWK